MSREALKKRKLAAITGKLDSDSDEEKEIEIDAHFDSHGNANVSHQIYTTYLASTNQTTSSSVLTHPEPSHQAASDAPAEKEKRKQVCMT
jgi:hypothetical protein